MILPTKYVPASESALGRAASLLTLRQSNVTVSELWHSYRRLDRETTYDGFVEALTLLYLIGVVAIDSGILEWSVRNET